MSIQPRVPDGVPTGGQWAARRRSEPTALPSAVVAECGHDALGGLRAECGGTVSAHDLVRSYNRLSGLLRPTVRAQLDELGLTKAQARLALFAATASAWFDEGGAEAMTQADELPESFRSMLVTVDPDDFRDDDGIDFDAWGQAHADQWQANASVHATPR